MSYLNSGRPGGRDTISEKSKTFNHRGAQRSTKESSQVDANLGWIGKNILGESTCQGDNGDMAWFKACAGVCTVMIAFLQFTPKIIENPNGRWLVLGLAVIASVSLMIVTVLEVREGKQRKLREQRNDRVLYDLNAREVLKAEQQSQQDRILQEQFQELFQRIESLTPKPSAPEPLETEPEIEPIDPELLRDFFVAEVDIRDRIRILARELFAFLREQGPGPLAVSHDVNKEPIKEYIGQVWEPLGEWIRAVHNGYDSRFREQLESLMKELKDKGVLDTGIEPWESNPPNGQTDYGIRAIAEKLFILAAKLDIAEM